MDTGGNVWSIRRIGAWFVFLHSDSRLLKIEILFKDTKIGFPPESVVVPSS